MTLLDDRESSFWQRGRFLSFIICLFSFSSMTFAAGVVVVAPSSGTSVSPANVAAQAATPPTSPPPAAKTSVPSNIATPTNSAAAPQDTNTPKIKGNESKANTTSPALPPIAQVIWIKGNVTAAQPNAAGRALERRSVIFEHDTITTGPTGSGQVGFTDGSVLALSADSKMNLDTYHYNKDAPKESKSVLSLVKGGFRTITGAIPKDNPTGYSIKTPVATIGVRGTKYSGYLSKNRGLVLEIETGTIEVANQAGVIDFVRCTEGTRSCHNYGIVDSYYSIPKRIAVRPPELVHTPPLQPVPSNWGAPGQPGRIGSPPVPAAKPAVTNSKDNDTGGAAVGGAGGTGGSSGGNSGSGNSSGPSPNSNGPAKTVSNFCVG